MFGEAVRRTWVSPLEWMYGVEGVAGTGLAPPPPPPRSAPVSEWGSDSKRGQVQQKGGSIGPVEATETRKMSLHFAFFCLSLLPHSGKATTFLR